jgi:hypothetical protein
MAGLVPAIPMKDAWCFLIEIAGTLGRSRPSSRAMPGDDKAY